MSTLTKSLLNVIADCVRRISVHRDREKKREKEWEIEREKSYAHVVNCSHWTQKYEEIPFKNSPLLNGFGSQPVVCVQINFDENLLVE